MLRYLFIDTYARDGSHETETINSVRDGLLDRTLRRDGPGHNIPKHPSGEENEG